MVDLAEIQAAYYMVAAIGVLVAAGFYVLNLRATNKARRTQLLNSLLSFTSSYDGMKRGEELLSLQWKDYDDWDKKYGNDLDIAASRYVIFGQYDPVGHLLKEGELDKKTVYHLIGLGAVSLWPKYEPVIRELRIRFNGSDWLEGFEYLSGEMMRIKKQKSPGYMAPDVFYKMPQPSFGP